MSCISMMHTRLLQRFYAATDAFKPAGPTFLMMAKLLRTKLGFFSPCSSPKGWPDASLGL